MYGAIILKHFSAKHERFNLNHSHILLSHLELGKWPEEYVKKAEQNKWIPTERIPAIAWWGLPNQNCKALTETSATSVWSQNKKIK